MSMKKLFLDTNVIIDVLTRREPFFLANANILEQGATGHCALFASVISFINGLYVSRKSLGTDQALQHIKTLRQIVSVAPTGEYEFDRALVMEGKDLEDNLQYQAALSAGCDCIITRNKKDFPSDGVLPVYTPTEFFEL